METYGSLIDTDVSTRRRGEFIQLVTDEYGYENVSQIGTFGTLAARAIIDAVGKVMEIDKAVIDEIKKNISETDGVKSIITFNPSLYEKHQKFIDMCIKLENLPRSTGAHAGGICISGNNKPVVAFAPVKLNKDGRVTTQYEMHDVESACLVKYDVLGLSTLDIIADTLELIGSDYYSYQFDYDDPAVYEMLSNGDTAGVFQAESGFMTNVFKQVKPKDILEVSDVIAIGRPDSIKYLDPYVKAKFSGEKIELIHPDLEKILSRTYGCLIYQEQIMNITKVFAGFSDGEADKFRKIVAKKKLELLPEQLEKFKSRAMERGYSSDVVEKLSQLLQDNANYSFNMAHSCAYAITTYKTAYLKYHYPVEFMTAVLNNQKKEDNGQTDYEGVSTYIKVCRDMDIKVLPPDINKSQYGFIPDSESRSIIYGFGLIKGVGESGIDIINNTRPFSSIKDFLTKAGADMNKTSVISLIKSGALDIITDIGRADMLKMYFALRFWDKKETCKPISTINKNHIKYLFDNGLITPDQKEDKEACIKILNQDRLENAWKEFQDKYMQGTELDWEMETVNAFMSGDPFEGIELPDWNSVTEGKFGWVAGTVIDISKTKIKNGENKGAQMAFINLESSCGIIYAVVFSKQWIKCQDVIKFGRTVLLYGEKTGELTMKVQDSITLDVYKRKVAGRDS